MFDNIEAWAIAMLVLGILNCIITSAILYYLVKLQTASKAVPQQLSSQRRNKPIPQQSSSSSAEKWTCPQCGNENPGTTFKCTGCSYLLV